MTTLKLALNDWPQRALRIDRVWLTIAVLFAGLALLNPIQAGSSIEFTLQALWDVLPFLLLSIAIAAYAKASGADNLIARAFQGRTLPMITFAAAMGALSPFCSCGVIPLIAALLAMGVPLAPVMAFWLASPLMDPSMFVLTIGTLGTEFAFAKALAAFSIGLFGGLGIWLIQRNGGFSDPLREGIGDGGCGGAKVRKPKAVVWSFWQDSERRRSFLEGARDNLLFLGKWLTLAFVLESLMVAYIPPEWVAQAVGGEGLLPVISAALVGIPAYLNGYAALPLVGGL
ncbi:MAG: permease, partial [Candidatus Competibacteraceae bacterium]|nr:permease [Candidatus Competibacteraceae bacterium]